MLLVENLLDEITNEGSQTEGRHWFTPPHPYTLDQQPYTKLHWETKQAIVRRESMLPTTNDSRLLCLCTCISRMSGVVTDICGLFLRCCSSKNRSYPI